MQYPSDFKVDRDYYDIFNRQGLLMSRMISSSKSSYREYYPDNLVVFNANIIIESKGKVWFGDLSFPPDTNKVQNVCNELNEPLYVLYESDARFGSENDSINILKNKAVKIFKPNN